MGLVASKNAEVSGVVSHKKAWPVFDDQSVEKMAVNGEVSHKDSEKDTAYEYLCRLEEAKK